MSDAQQVAVVLTVLSTTCTEALQSLSTVPKLDKEHPRLSVILKDYTSLLSLVYSSTTKIGLALKPESPTHSAAIKPLHDIAKQTASVAHCVGLIENENHGATLRAEIVCLTKDVFEAIKSLSQTLLACGSADNHKFTAQAGGEYMIRIGTVHDCIEKAKNHSPNNATAASKKCKADEGSLNDALREVAEMIEDNGEEGGGEDLDEDDGWNELGLGPTQKMTKEELERTEKVHNLLKLTALLHKHVRLDLFPNCSPVLVDSFVENMTLLSPAADDMVAALYPPQDIERVNSEISAVKRVVEQIQNLVLQALDLVDLNARVASVKLEGQAKGGITGRAWTRDGFMTCFKQISSIADSIAPNVTK